MPHDAPNPYTRGKSAKVNTVNIYIFEYINLCDFGKTGIFTSIHSHAFIKRKLP